MLGLLLYVIYMYNFGENNTIITKSNVYKLLVHFISFHL